MTIIVETNVSTFKRIGDGELTFIVNKFTRPVAVGDTLIFQEINDDGHHTEKELSFKVSQTETGGVKSGFTAAAFKHDSDNY